MSERYPTDVPMDDEDRALLDEIRRVASVVDPVPDDLAERTLFAMMLARLQAEVMEIQREGLPEPVLRSEEVGQGTVQATTITFAADAVTVMITVSESPTGGLCIDGWAAPPEPYVVELYRPDDRVRVESDDDGRFVLFDVPYGRAALALRRTDGTGPTVCTPVIEL